MTPPFFLYIVLPSFLFLSWFCSASSLMAAASSSSSSSPPPPPPSSCSWSVAMSPGCLPSVLYNLETDDDDASGSRKVPLVIPVLASLLERTIARNERAAREGGPRAVSASSVDGDDGGLAAFGSRRVLDMTLQSFLGRFFRYAHVTPAVYVVAYVYMDRLCQLNPRVRVCSTNVQRLLVTAIMVASKFVEDMNYSNSYFAEVGGLAARELNGLELKFLFMMRFKLHVSLSVYESYCSHLEREASVGGGYQVERSLRRSVCAEASSAEGQRRELSDQMAPGVL